MGIVYEVEDRARGARVALKTLRAAGADALLRFKNEFRSLQEISHPSLVSLYELIEDAGQWFFTMELVRGQDFLSHVRPGDQADINDTVVDEFATASPPPGPRTGHFDEERLRSALRGLADALAILHAAGKVHRDIKPQNILVTAEGRVVLVDFGLIADVDWDAVETRAIGTAAYMAPEQAGARMVGPAADWYAVGAILYEATTGRLPFIGESSEVLAVKSARRPDPPSQHAAGIPSDLEALCMDLLDPDPGARPSEAVILARLGAPRASVERARGASPVFVGRRAELARLHDAFEAVGPGRPVTVAVVGESGVGKSTLVRRFVDLLGEDEQDVLVLAGRCYERESVPYKGIDGVIDALSQALGRLPPTELAAILPPAAGFLGQVFPVLRRVVGDRAPDDRTDPFVQRARVFETLRSVLAALAARGPLLVVVEDLQWLDADSQALLGEVLRLGDGAPGLLLIVTARSTAPSFPGDVRLVPLDNLPAPDGRELARLLLLRATRRPTELTTSEAIASEASGHPLFIDELVRRKIDGHGGVLRLDEALWARVNALAPHARAIVEAVVVAGEPLAIEAAAVALGQAPAVISVLAGQLAASHLVRATTIGALEPYHDRVRDAVLAFLDRDELKTWHRRLATALEVTCTGDDEALALHHHDAGEDQQAARHAELAADRAAAALAFARAARLYRMALGFAPDDAPAKLRLQLGLAEALVNVGRGAEAAEVYLEAIAHAPREAGLDLRRRAAEQFLKTGRIDRGVEVLREVLAEVKLELPATPRRALASLLLRRAQLRVRGIRFRARAAPLSAADAARLDICWAVGASMGVLDTVRGADFQTRHLLLALAAGDPRHIALALAGEAAYSAAAGRKNERRTGRLVAASVALAGRLDDDATRGATLLCSGIAAFLEGHFAAARAACDQAEALLRERCRGVSWEITTAQIFALWSRAYLGELAELGRRVPLALKEARERGDLYASTSLRIGWAVLAPLAAGDPERARTEAVEAIERWSRKLLLNQHADFLIGEVAVDLYRGDGDAAVKRLADAWPELRGSVLPHVQITRCELLSLRGRALLAVAAAATTVDPLLLRVEADTLRLHREGPPYARAWADLLGAGIASVRGDERACAHRFALAIERFEREGMKLEATAARARRADLLAVGGGDEARAWLVEQGVVEPENLIRVFVPF